MCMPDDMRHNAVWMKHGPVPIKLNSFQLNAIAKRAKQCNNVKHLAAQCLMQMPGIDMSKPFSTALAKVHVLMEHALKQPGLFNC